MSNGRKARSAAWKEYLATHPNMLVPIPHDEDMDTRLKLHRIMRERLGAYVPPPWPRWGLAAAYVSLEIHRTPRTLERAANLATVAKGRLGGIAITD